ncbi:MAG: slipin family protein [Coriobacteriales bacterium]|nr:slipin family protein [Coriobacteriales bacterium]
MGKAGTTKKDSKALNAWSVSSGSNPMYDGYRFDTNRRTASRNGAIVFTITVFGVVFALTLTVAGLLFDGIGIAAVLLGLVCAYLVSTSMSIVQEWEKAVVLRLGRFNRVAGPGLVLTIPIIEYKPLRIDQRVMATYFGAEETLTSDLVPLNVDAVLFWVVYDTKNACVEVEDYASAVAWVAQTTMRDAIGRTTVAEVVSRRDQLDEDLKGVIEGKLSSWGIAIIDVEIRDIVIPKELQEAMSFEAAVEREKNARIALAEIEKDISEMLADASVAYENNENAMKLRTMHLAYESVRRSGGTVVIPSAFSDGFADSPADKANR